MIARAQVGRVEEEWSFDEETYWSSWQGELLGEDRLGISISAAGSLVDAEHAAFQASEGFHEGAFLDLYACACRLLNAGLFCEGLVIPHLGSAFGWVAPDDEQWTDYVLDGEEESLGRGIGLSAGIKELMSMWEPLSKAPYRERVQDWEKIASVCWSLANESPGLQSEGFGEVEVEGGVDLTTYWAMAHAFALAQMSPTEFARQRARENYQQRQERLQVDFFPDQWDLLHQSTRQSLVLTDSLFYRALHTGAWGPGVLDELLSAVQNELYETLFRPLEDKLEGVFQEWKRRPRLSSLHPDSIHIGDMANLLQTTGRKPQDVLPLSDLLERAGLTSRQKRFLYKQLPTFLLRLWVASKLVEHDDEPTFEDISLLRRQALGIGCAGVLPRLVRIKEKIEGIEKRPLAS